MIEIFKDIEGFEGLYKISNQGRVLSLNYNRTGKEKILKPTKNHKGYLTVALYKEGKQKRYKVHRLVAQMFLPNPDNLPEVNHKDEDKTNNTIQNLEWCTNEYNHNYGTRNKRVGESLSKQVICVETGVVYPSTMEIERQFGFRNGNISSACTGRYKTCGGFHWKYVI